MPSARNGHPRAESRLSTQGLGLARTVVRSIPQRTRSSKAARGVERVNMLLCNAYLVGKRDASDRDWAVVDCGISWGTPALVAAAERRFGATSRPAAIILTHGHFDHVGGLPGLAYQWDVPIYCHPLELPYVTGQASYPAPKPTAGGAMSWLSPFFPRGPFDFADRVRTLPEDGTVPGMPGWRWIHTAGHTPGHVSLWREADRVLLVGDAFVNTRQESAMSVLLQKAEVSRPPAYYTPDWYEARRSVERLANLQPETAATGHGPVIAGERLRRGLSALLSSWDDTVGEGGRYDGDRAMASRALLKRTGRSTGKRRRLQVAAGIGLAAIVASMLWRRRS